MEINYVNEHLLPGKLGNGFVILSTVSALLGTVSYFLASRSESSELKWKSFARTAFYIHSASVALIICTLFYMLVNRYFEYHYVWQHSSSQMEMRYIFACFWEGQEGSFLLWMFWNMVLGAILLRSSGSFEAPVMTIFSSVQVFLSSMLLGIYLGDYTIGSSPFNVLLREHADFAMAPIFQRADYLQFLDGKGLNPLLQNYWMTIHPPTLFLGFALTLVPFCFAIAALWKKRYSGWMKPAIPWTFFGVAVLGTGILMGGVWAYEALSFGGFWAWDPVENASLVPWLTLIGTGHLLMINKRYSLEEASIQPSSYFTTFLFPIITFSLVLYSTFLTRSGVLGEASVHAFTDLGMSGQLLIYLLFYLLAGIGLLLWRRRDLPKSKGEDTLWSREFWMFVGAMVLFISAFQISSTTSIPVVNKIVGTKFAPPANAIEHYNAWQIPIAIVLGLAIGMGLHLKHKKTDFGAFVRQLSYSIATALIATGFTGYLLGMFHSSEHNLRSALYLGLMFSSWFAIFANTDYWLRITSGKIKKAGAALSHAGIGLILLGALISTSRQKIISSNVTDVDISRIGKEFKNNEHILLFKNDTLRMDDYYVVYKGRTQEGVNVLYETEYLRRNDDGTCKKEFTLYPRVQKNDKMGNVAEPDTRHFLDKDIYSHVTYAEMEEPKPGPDDYKEPVRHKMAVGDSVFASTSIIVLESFEKNINKTQYNLSDSDLAVMAIVQVTDMSMKKYYARPLYVLRGNSSFTIPVEIEDLGLAIGFEKIFPEENKFELTLVEKKRSSKEFIIMKAILFPYINILWAGCIIFLIGTLIAVWQRVKKNKGV